MANTSKFRNPVSNQRYTKQLFLDNFVNIPLDLRTFEPLYTLHHDHDGYINFRKEYLKDEDSTGYTTACRLLENYDHWQMLMKTIWFREAKAIWDEELNAKLESRAIKTVADILSNDDLKPAERITAAKVLLGKANASKPSTRPSRGRPSKEEIHGELKIQTALTKEIEDDLARIREVKNHA